VDKISLEMSFHFLSDDIVRFKIKVEVYKKYTKMQQSLHAKNLASLHAVAGRRNGDDQSCQLIFGTHCQTLSKMPYHCDPNKLSMQHVCQQSC